MLVPAQPLPLPNPAPAPFEPITTLIAAKIFLGGIDAIQLIAGSSCFPCRSVCGGSAAARGRGADESSSSDKGKAGDEGEASDTEGKAAVERQESYSSALEIVREDKHTQSIYC